MRPNTEPPLASSFRDPQGALLAIGDRIFRIVNAAGMADLDALLASAAAAKWTSAGALIRTTVLGDADRRDLLEDARVAELYGNIRGEAILEHERIPFPSFPYEWAPEMLHAAAMLTLELALDLLPEALGLKDATPYNVLFRGPQPVFIDILSLERRDPGDSTWLPYAQFVRTFLLPLAANRHFGLALDQLLFTRRDGLEPEEVYRWLGPLERVRLPFLSLVSMPVWLGSHHDEDDASIYRKKVLPDAERAQFIVRTLLNGLKRKLPGLATKSGVSSAWTGYMDLGNNYTAEHFAAKERFVAECLSAHAPKRVLDVGCNTGHFSFMAARSGARVVAIDYDPAVAGTVWRQAAAGKLDVLPLVVNLTRPTPGMGWNNREWPSFLDRARGSFDAVFMLAVVHHMLVTERVPLNEIIDLAAELTSDLLVIEFVSPQDSMFRRLVRGREELHQDLTHEVFENACRRHFQMARVQHLEGTSRWLYLLRKLTP
jgi:SAM-dependent methyltransferase